MDTADSEQFSFSNSAFIGFLDFYLAFCLSELLAFCCVMTARRVTAIFRLQDDVTVTRVEHRNSENSDFLSMLLFYPNYVENIMKRIK